MGNDQLPIICLSWSQKKRCSVVFVHPEEVPAVHFPADSRQETAKSKKCHGAFVLGEPQDTHLPNAFGHALLATAGAAKTRTRGRKKFRPLSRPLRLGEPVRCGCSPRYRNWRGSPYERLHQKAIALCSIEGRSPPN